MPSKPLSVEAIYVPIDGHRHAVRADGFLSSLSDSEYAQLRKNVTTARKKDTDFLLCGDCRAPVFARESKTGRRHCAHFGTSAHGCRWSGAVAEKITSIDAAKFQGNQESEQHKYLKSVIVEILSLSPNAAAAGIHMERYTKGISGDYAYPDVSAQQWRGSKAAFEIQLSTTHVPVITKRESFYEENGFRLCWLVSGDEARLDNRTYKDIYLRNDGQILGVDAEVLEVSRARSKAHFRLFRLLPSSVESSFTATWKSKIVDADEIEWGEFNARPVSKGPSFDQYLAQLLDRNWQAKETRSEFFNALRDADCQSAETHWNRAAKAVGGLRWDQLPDEYGTVRAMGVLATLQEGEKLVKSKIEATNRPHLVNTMLLEPPERRPWTHALVALAQARGLRLEENQAVKNKIQRNRLEGIAVKPLDLACGPVFNYFFPMGAFSRLQLTTT